MQMLILCKCAVHEFMCANVAHSGPLQQRSDAEVSSLFLGGWGVALLPTGS